MGKRGPRPQPSHLKLLRGSPSHEKINRDEPQPELPVSMLDAPEYLTGYAMDEWYRVAEELHNLRLLDARRHPSAGRLLPGLCDLAHRRLKRCARSPRAIRQCAAC